MAWQGKCQSRRTSLSSRALLVLTPCHHFRPYRRTSFASRPRSMCFAVMCSSASPQPTPAFIPTPRRCVTVALIDLPRVLCFQSPVFTLFAHALLLSIFPPLVSRFYHSNLSRRATTTRRSSTGIGRRLPNKPAAPIAKWVGGGLDGDPVRNRFVRKPGAVFFLLSRRGSRPSASSHKD